MMKKLYEKSELGFALVWIGIYCVGMSIFDEISRSIAVGLLRFRRVHGSGRDPVCARGGICSGFAEDFAEG